MIPQWALSALQDKIDPVVAQRPSLSKTDIILAMLAQVKAGTAFFVCFYPMIFFVQEQTEWLATIHLFSCGSTWNTVRAMKQFNDWAQSSKYLKFEGRSHLKSVKTLAKRCGWALEGLRRSAFFDGNALIDEYEFGLEVTHG